MSDSLEAIVRELADERAIIQLAVRYCRAVDARDYAALRDLFVPDATAHLGDADPEGIDAIIDHLRRALDPCDVTQHLVGGHLVTVDADTATAECDLHAQHVRKGTEGGSRFILGGRYRDRLARTDDGWRITRRDLDFTWFSGNPAVIEAVRPN